MQKLGRLRAAEETREQDLPAGRRQQIVATDDERHALHVVVHRRAELIRPVAVAIAHEEIAALLRRPLLLRSVTQIDEPLDGRIEAHAQAESGGIGEPTVAAGARIPLALNVSPRAAACVDKAVTLERLERLSVDVSPVALTDWNSIGHKPKPIQIVEDGGLEFGPAALSIVVLDPQEYACITRARLAPDIEGIDDVSEVEEAGWRRREPGYIYAHVSTQMSRARRRVARRRPRRRLYRCRDCAGS